MTRAALLPRLGTGLNGALAGALAGLTLAGVLAASAPAYAFTVTPAPDGASVWIAREATDTGAALVTVYEQDEWAGPSKTDTIPAEVSGETLLYAGSGGWWSLETGNGQRWRVYRQDVQTSVSSIAQNVLVEPANGTMPVGYGDSPDYPDPFPVSMDGSLSVPATVTAEAGPETAGALSMVVVTSGLMVGAMFWQQRRAG